MLTSSAEERDLAESYQLGVNSYILKPIDFDDFTETVRKLGSYWLLVNQPPPNPVGVGSRPPSLINAHTSK